MNRKITIKWKNIDGVEQLEIKRLIKKKTFSRRKWESFLFYEQKFKKGKRKIKDEVFALTFDKSKTFFYLLERESCGKI